MVQFVDCYLYGNHSMERTSLYFIFAEYFAQGDSEDIERIQQWMDTYNEVNALLLLMVSAG